MPQMCSSHSQLILRAITHFSRQSSDRPSPFIYPRFHHSPSQSYRLCTNTQQVELTHLRLRKDATPCATSLGVSLQQTQSVGESSVHQPEQKSLMWVKQ